jgi:hypothetical protein
MYARRVFLLDEGDDFAVFVGIFPKVGIFKVDKEDGQVVGRAEEVLIGFLDRLEVGGGDILFVVSAAALYVFDEAFDGPVEVDQESGFGEGGVEDVEEALKQAVFFLVEVVFCEEEGFYEVVVGHDGFLKEVGLEEAVLELFMAFGEEKQFDGKGVALRVFVEIGQEGVVCELLEHEAAGEVPFQHFAQGGFPGADIAFDGDKLVGQRSCHSLGLLFE